MSNAEAIKKPENAPDRIWATVNGMSTRYPDGSRQLIGGWQQDGGQGGAVEYVRASTLEALQRENERLQAELNRHLSGGPADHRYWEGRYRDEAAENERLRSVLRPMAEVAGDVSESWPDDAQVVTEIGHFRRARTALASAGEEHHAE